MCGPVVGLGGGQHMDPRPTARSAVGGAPTSSQAGGPHAAVRHPDCPAPERAGYVTDRFTQHSSRVFSLLGTNVKGQWALPFFHSLLLWYLNMLVIHFTHTTFVMIFADFPRYFSDLKFI